MRPEKIHKICVFVSAMGAMLAYGLATRNPVAPVLSMAGGAFAWWLSGTSVPKVVPRILVNLIVVAAVAYTFWVAVTGFVEIRLIANLLLWLLVIKMYDRTSKRDDAQVLVLTVFIAIAAVLEDVRLSIGAVLTLMSPFLASGVMLQQIVSGAEQAEKSRASPWGKTAPLGPALAVGRRAGAHFRRLLGATMTVIAVLAFGVFVAVPRGMGDGMYGNVGQRSGEQTTGFSSEVSLGSPGLITESQRIVMHVEIETPEGENLGSGDKVYYLRGSVLTRYDEGRGRWTDGRQRRGSSVISFAGEPMTVVGAIDGSIVRQRYTLVDYAGEEKYLFSLLHPVSIVSSPGLSLRIDNETRSMRARELQRRFEYTVDSVEVARRTFDNEIGDGSPQGAGEAARTSSPAGRPLEADGEIRSLTLDILREKNVAIPEYWTGGEVARAATTLRDWLSDSFEYTLELEASPRGRDPTEWFLTERKRGHCEYFASALARMCHSIGISARLVTGFVAAEWSPVTGHYVVRASNAHAWVEVDHGSNDWRTYDATPPAEFSRHHRASGGVLSDLLSIFDAIDQWWATNVVTYQGRGIDITRVREDSMSVLRDFVRPPTTDEEGGGVSDQLFIVIALVAGVPMVLYAVYRAAVAGWRRTHAKNGAKESDLRVPAATSRAAFELHDAMLKAFRRLRSPKPAWTPPVAHIRGLAADEGAIAALREAADLYYRVVFAGVSVPREALADARRRIASIGRASAR